MKLLNRFRRIVLILYGLGVALTFLWVPWTEDVGYWFLWSAPRPIKIDKDIVAETRERWKADMRANELATLGPKWLEALREAPAKDKEKVRREAEIARGLATLRRAELSDLRLMSDEEVLSWLRNEQDFLSAFPENKNLDAANRKALLDEWESTVPAAKKWNELVQYAKTDYRRMGFELAVLTALRAVAFFLAPPLEQRSGIRSKYASDADAWLNWAEAAYAGAQTLFLSDNALVWFSAGILGHQALEMFLKAALIRKGHRVDEQDVWGHDLRKLAQKLNRHCAACTPEFMKELQKFTDYFNELRYPAELKNVIGLGQEESALLQHLVQVLRPYAKT